MVKKAKKIKGKKVSKTPAEQELKLDTVIDALIKGYGKETSEENKKLFSAIFLRYLKKVSGNIQKRYLCRSRVRMDILITPIIDLSIIQQIIKNKIKVIINRNNNLSDEIISLCKDNDIILMPKNFDVKEIVYELRK